MILSLLSDLRLSILEQEDKKVLSLIIDKKHILDYGCGLGRYLIPLTSQGIDCTGIDINDYIVSSLIDKGLKALTANAFNNSDDKYDCIILSHIIEHINAHNIVEFLDKLLDRLEKGGCLIIATPLLYNEFYDDYDHIKPYTYKSISILFSDYAQQQIKPKNRLRCEYVWYRKWAYCLKILPQEKMIISHFKKAFNVILEVLFYLTLKTLSRKTGYVGLFVKL
jgi:SAM-dependent methyltransferase